MHQFLELLTGSGGAVDLDVDGDALGALTGGVIDAEESGEVDVEAEGEPDLLQLDVSGRGQGGEGDHVAAGQTLEEVLGGADGGVGAQQRNGLVAVRRELATAGLVG